MSGGKPIMRPGDGRGKWTREKNAVRVDGATAFIEIVRRGLPPVEMLMDVSDLPRLSEIGRITLALKPEDGHPYAAFTRVDPDGIRRTVKVHRWLTNCPGHLVVDHINHSELDNRQSNLRCVSPAENNLNRRGPMRVSTTGLRCIQMTPKGKYRARVKRKNLGSFDEPQQAADAVNSYLRSLGVPCS